MTVLLSLGLLFNLVYLNAGAGLLDERVVFIGEPVTLQCLNLIPQRNCSKVTWLSNGSPAVELVTLGMQNPDMSKKRKNRVDFMPDCSLQISHIKDRDYGCYTCRQYSAVGGTKLTEDARICLLHKKDITTTEKNDATSMDNNDVLASSSEDRKKLLIIIILSVLTVAALSVMALIAWFRNHRRAQTENENTLEHGTITVEQGEDVLTYTELNHSIMKPRNVDKYEKHQKTEYAVIKL